MGYGIKIRVINYTIQTCFISVGYQKFSQILHKFSSVISRDQTPTPHFFVKIDNYSNGWTPTGCSRLHSQNITHTSSTQHYCYMNIHVWHNIMMYWHRQQHKHILYPRSALTWSIITAKLVDIEDRELDFGMRIAHLPAGGGCVFFPIVCVTKLPFNYKVYG